MSNVLPINGKVPCKGCGLPFKPAYPTLLCPECTRWQQAAESLARAKQLLQPKDA